MHRLHGEKVSSNRLDTNSRKVTSKPLTAGKVRSCADQSLRHITMKKLNDRPHHFIGFHPCQKRLQLDKRIGRLPGGE
jgi:hypothetical protein